MKVLWFEVTVPARYKSGEEPIGGWQDSLQNAVMGTPGLELTIAFEYVKGDGEEKVIDGVRYIPINTHYNLLERQRRGMGWEVVMEKVNPKADEIVRRIKPDVIHVFGSEWSFGLVAENTDIPVVIHMQGCIAPYNNADLPPMYSRRDLAASYGLNIKARLSLLKVKRCNASRQAMEARVFKAVKYYMGRTAWDHALVTLFHPGSKYFYCSEALRPSFLKAANPWKPTGNKKFRIISTGVGLRKGFDTTVRAAKILKEYGFDFEWICAGKLGDRDRRLIEMKEKTHIEDNNIILPGFLSPDELLKTLLSSDLYIHAAYMENSPNSICEAQYLGMPILATYEGGVPSLIENGKEGILIHTNAPYTMASVIISLSNDTERCVRMGAASRKRAVERHDPKNIVRDLFNCYNAIIEDSKKTKK